MTGTLERLLESTADAIKSLSGRAKTDAEEFELRQQAAAGLRKKMWEIMDSLKSDPSLIEPTWSFLDGLIRKDRAEKLEAEAKRLRGIDGLDNQATDTGSRETSSGNDETEPVVPGAA